MSIITKQTEKLARNITKEHEKLLAEADEKMRYKLYDIFKDMFEDDRSLMEISWIHSTDMDKFVNIECEDEDLRTILQCYIPPHLFTELFGHWCTVTVHRYGDITVEDHNTKETNYYEMMVRSISDQ